MHRVWKPSIGYLQALGRYLESILLVQFQVRPLSGEVNIRGWLAMFIFRPELLKVAVMVGMVVVPAITMCCSQDL
jgi:hypothetical protein